MTKNLVQKIDAPYRVAALLTLLIASWVYPQIWAREHLLWLLGALGVALPFCAVRRASRNPWAVASLGIVMTFVNFSMFGPRPCTGHCGAAHHAQVGGTLFALTLLVFGASLVGRILGFEWFATKVLRLALLMTACLVLTPLLNHLILSQLA